MRFSGWLGIPLALMTLALGLACSWLGGGVRLQAPGAPWAVPYWCFVDSDFMQVGDDFRRLERVSEHSFIVKTPGPDAPGGRYKLVTVHGTTLHWEDDPYSAGCDEVKGFPGPDSYFGCKQGELWGIRRGTRELVKPTYERVSGDFEGGLLVVDGKGVLNLETHNRFDLPEAEECLIKAGWILGHHANGMESVWDKAGNKLAEGAYVRVLDEEHLVVYSKSPFVEGIPYLAYNDSFGENTPSSLAEYAPRGIGPSRKLVSLPFFPWYGLGDLWIMGSPSQLVTSEGDVRFAVPSGVLRPAGSNRLVWLRRPTDDLGKLMNLEGKILSSDLVWVGDDDNSPFSDHVVVGSDRWYAAKDQITTQCGYIDRDGNRVLGFHKGWIDCFPFSGEIAVVTTDADYIIVDREGEEVVFR